MSELQACGSTIVHLVDFVVDRHGGGYSKEVSSSSEGSEYLPTLFKFLQSKMRKYSKNVSFDYQRFDARVATMVGGENDHMSYPLDVKVSNDYQCILVCDQLKNRIVVYDLNSLKQKKSIEWFSDSIRPRYMAIEIIESRELYFYFTNTKFGIVKCKLSTLLGSVNDVDDVDKNDNSNSRLVVSEIKEWTKQIDDPQGITIKYKPYNQNLLFASEKTSKKIQIIDCQTSTTLRVISHPTEITGPWSIAFNSLGDLIVGDSDSRKIVVLREDGETYSIVNSFGSFKDIYGIAIDYSNDYIYASDFANAIQVFTPTGEIVKKLTHASILNPIGIFIDNKSGRLLFSDYSSMQLVCLASPDYKF